MNFIGLEEALRKELRKRIAARELTGMEVARRTNFTQAHISNFLNRKRGLKLAALDRTLKALGISLYDLLDPHHLARFAAVPVSAVADEANVPIVSPEVATGCEVIIREEVRAMAHYRRALLNRIRPDLATAACRSWTRFVVLESSAHDAAVMSPRLSPGALLLLDRHYTTLRPYRKNARNLYAVRKEHTCVVRYVEAAGECLILRPQNLGSPVEVIAIPEGHSATDLLVGRIAHLSLEP